ncbi:hypothetical protein [Azohydromonas aeria]|uniref:hypothetical protein n=1 Tax=Azohydromonas aeria TaxID=2590212 RepID=UPI0012FAEA5D|nr:hypothetical protein [Azohydromonas aeria]
MPHACNAAPSLEALFAATLALMTRWAQAATPTGGEAACGHRSLLARKIVSNLLFLQHHPQASEQFRQIVANVHRSWQDVACAAQAGMPALSPRALTPGHSLH